MPSESTYRINDKGLAAAASESGELTPSLRELLGLIGQKTTFAEVRSKLPQVAEATLREVLRTLVSKGYLETVDTDVTASDLDIRRYFNHALVEPTLLQRRQAEQQTISGMRSVDRAGYHVNILNRSGKRIPPRSGSTYHAIIIDGDEGNSLVMVRALLLAGFDTRAASRRDDILSELGRQPPVDVIAMDVVLPDVIGLELLGRLREHPFFKTVPVIVMTARAEHDDVVAALSYGANGYMTKPFKPEALLDSVNAVLGLG